MKLKVVSIGNSHGVIIPRPVMELFEINGNDFYKASFSKSRIVLDKIKIEKSKLKPPEKPIEDEPIMETIIPRRKVPVEKPIENEPTETEEPHSSIIVWCKCPYCGDVFTSKSELNFHILYCPKGESKFQ